MDNSTTETLHPTTIDGQIILMAEQKFMDVVVVTTVLQAPVVIAIVTYVFCVGDGPIASPNHRWETIFLSLEKKAIW